MKAIPWLRRFSSGPALAAVLLLALLPLALASQPYLMFLANTIVIFAMLALGLQLALGYGGILQLGYAGFFGLGAYASAILSTKLGWPFPAAFAAAIAVAVAGGLLMSPIVRLRDVNFAMATFVFGLILELLYNQWSDLTGGPIGLRGVPPPALAGFELVDPFHTYYLLYGCAVAVFILLFRLLHSPFGTALKAMRENETACRTSGIDVARLKVVVLLISSAIAGAAGSLLAHMNGYISPPTFGWNASIIILMMIVLGGLRSLAGAIVGAIVIRLLLEWTSVLGSQSNIVFGIALVVFMAALPRGLAGLVSQWRARAARSNG